MDFNAAFPHQEHDALLRNWEYYFTRIVTFLQANVKAKSVKVLLEKLQDDKVNESEYNLLYCNKL